MATNTLSGNLALDALAGLDNGFTIPCSWYTDPAVYSQEQSAIFRKSWQYVGLTQDVAAPGDFFTCHAGNVPLVIIRDNDNSLHALVNVCRHRGSEVVLEPCGAKKALQCSYHAWTYGLDGSLIAAPGMRGEPDFDKDEFGLAKAQIDTWGPFIFVNPDLDARPLSRFLGELPELVAQTGLRFNDVKRRVRHHYDLKANWKVVVDNYLECYHCPVAHPGFVALIDTDDYLIREYEWFSTQTGSLKKHDAGTTQLYDTAGEVQDGFYAFLWPNWTINIYPGPGILSINLFLPTGVDSTRAIFEYCFVDAVDKETEDDFVKFIDQVQVEDVVLCDMVQRGLSTGYLERGKLMLSQEAALRHFQRLVANALSG